MKLATVISIVLSSSMVLAQNRVLYSEKPIDGEANQALNRRLVLCQKLKLDTVQFSKFSFHFRLWNNKQAIDLWKDSEGRNHGKITSWVTQYILDAEEQKDSIYYEINELDSAQANRLFEIIDSNKTPYLQDQVQKEDYIVVDGFNYDIETTTLNDYYFRTYEAFRLQDSTTENRLIQDFIDQIQEIAQAYDTWIQFTNRIPFECFHYGGSGVFCTSFSKKKRK